MGHSTSCTVVTTAQEQARSLVTKWTPEQIDNIVKYGLCEVCGEPRELYHGSYQNVDSVRVMILCSADPGHSTNDIELTRYPRHGNKPSEDDPTHGRIDRDIQWRVDHVLP